MRTLHKNKRMQLLTINIIVFIAFVFILELTLRNYAPITTYHLDVSSEIARQVGWGPELSKSGGFLCDNSHDKSSKEKKSILTIGDSMLACNPVQGFPFKDSIPGKLGKNLGDKFEVFNLAAGGWGTDQQLLAYKHYKKNNAFDLVLLFYTPANDLFNNSSNKAIGQNLRKPYYNLVNGDLEYNFFNNNEPNSLQKIIINSEIGKRYLGLLGKPIFETLTFKEVDIRSSSKYEHERFSHMAANITPMLPRYADSWKITKKIIKLLDEEVVSNGAQFAIIYLPTGIRNLLEPTETYPTNCIGYKSDEKDIVLSHHGKQIIVNPYHQYNLMKDFAEKNNIVLIDGFIDKFHPYYDSHTKLAPDCIHYNKDSYAISIIEKEVAEYVRGLNI
jgi:hypothetical protein